MGDGGEAEPPGGQCVVEPGCLLYGIQEVNMKREKSHGPDIFFKGMAPSHLTPFCWALPLLRIPQAGHQAFITRAFGGIIQTHIIDGCIIKVYTCAFLSTTKLPLEVLMHPSLGRHGLSPNLSLFKSSLNLSHL